MARLTIGQAAKFSGYSKSTISRACKEKKLTHERDGNTILIDQSELVRLFPPKTDATPRQNVLSNGANIAAHPPAMDAEIAKLRAELNAAKEMLDRERLITDILKDQLDTMKRLIPDNRPQVEAAPPRRGFRWPWQS